MMDEKIAELTKLLDEIPKMKDSDEFDAELEKRRKILKQIHIDYESLRRCLEKIWATKVWEEGVEDKRPMHIVKKKVKTSYVGRLDE